MMTLQEWLVHQRHIMQHDPDVASEHHEKALRIIEALVKASCRVSCRVVSEEIAERIINEKESR